MDAVRSAPPHITLIVGYVYFKLRRTGGYAKLRYVNYTVYEQKIFSNKIKMPRLRRISQGGSSKEVV